MQVQKVKIYFEVLVNSTRAGGRVAVQMGFFIIFSAMEKDTETKIGIFS